MDYRRFRNLNESFAAKETSKGMSFAEALDELDFEEVEDIEECAGEPIEESADIGLTFENCKDTFDVFKVWAKRLGYSKGEYPYEFLQHAFEMGTEGREVDDEWYDIKDDFEPWGVWSDLQTINEAGLDYYNTEFEKALKAQADYDKERLGEQASEQQESEELK